MQKAPSSIRVREENPLSEGDGDYDMDEAQVPVLPQEDTDLERGLARPKARHQRRRTTTPAEPPARPCRKKEQCVQHFSRGSEDEALQLEHAKYFALFTVR